MCKSAVITKYVDPRYWYVEKSYFLLRLGITNFKLRDC